MNLIMNKLLGGTASKKDAAVRILFSAGIISLSVLLVAGCSGKGASHEDTTDKYGYNVWDYVELGAYEDLKVEAIAEGEAEASEIRENLIDDLWSQIQENSTVTGYPQELYDDMADYYATELESEAAAWEMEVEEYLDFFYEYSKEEYIEECLQGELLMEAVTTATGVSLEDGDYDKMIGEYLEDMGCESVEEAEELYGREEIEEYLLTQKVYDFLIGHAAITEVSYDEYYGTDTEELWDTEGLWDTEELTESL